MPGGLASLLLIRERWLRLARNEVLRDADEMGVGSFGLFE